jgi:hypothetical protein
VSSEPRHATPVPRVLRRVVAERRNPANLRSSPYRNTPGCCAGGGPKPDGVGIGGADGAGGTAAVGGAAGAAGFFAGLTLAAGGFCRVAGAAPFAGSSAATTGSGSIVVVETDDTPASESRLLSWAIETWTGIV